MAERELVMREQEKPEQSQAGEREEMARHTKAPEVARETDTQMFSARRKSFNSTSYSRMSSDVAVLTFIFSNHFQIVGHNKGIVLYERARSWRTIIRFATSLSSSEYMLRQFGYKDDM